MCASNSASNSTPNNLNNNLNNWYSKPIEEVFLILSTDKKGLSEDEAKFRLKKYGYNEIKIKKKNPVIRFLLQFHNPLIYVLLVSFAVTVILGMWSDAIVILLVVFLNAVVGFIFEEKAESAIDALRKMMAYECIVFREGKKKTIPAKELVIGDVVEIESGKKIPADLRLFYVKNMASDESILTGESVPVDKNTQPVFKENPVLSDQKCIAFCGTYVVRGFGKGVVVATSEKTEFGKIAKITGENRKITTPLTKKVKTLTKYILITTILFACLNFILGITMKYSLIYSFLASISFAVAVIPEALPVIITVLFAFASITMAKKNAIIRNLPAVETLGCATVICTDKTGTLTKNKMTVVKIFAGEKFYAVTGVGYNPQGKFILENKDIDPLKASSELIETLRCGFLCNKSKLLEKKNEYTILGDPTEGALIVSAVKAGVRVLPENSLILDEIPFESEQQYMATLHNREKGSRVIYAKGAPEKILGMCKYQLINGNPVVLTDFDRENILKHAHEMANESLRLVASAHKIVFEEKMNLEEKDLEGLVFLGIQGMIDPPREEVIDAVKKCKNAGIKVVMITGDHVETAKAIAKQTGFYKEGDRILSGEELSKISDDELYQIINSISVYARISPLDKFRIVKQLRKRGHVVAVTGDGVNDAPALRSADVGIAMGISGTEVSKEAADMVLTDDNFATIVNAIEEGRHVWKNFQKIILFLLSTNVAQGLIVFFAILFASFIPLFAHRLPLEPIHILWINLVGATFLTLPLIMEPKEEGLLNAKPRNQKENLINELLFTRLAIVSLMTVISAFTIYYFFGNPASDSNTDEFLLTQAQTAAFMSVNLVLIGFLFTARSLHNSAFSFSPFSNKWVIIGVLIAFGTQLMITYIPFLQEIFRTAAFPLEWWPAIALTFFSAFIGVEIEKFLRRKFKKICANV